MFDSLRNTKFYNKCKHAFKCIRTRTGPIRRKRHAIIRFLKKDVADLLANGSDTHAFGRMEGLMVEFNRSYCYDMILQFCDKIQKQLGSLQKQRECPTENREAVSTLIFAAAHFPDLPELRDLRHIFTERYGSSVEHFVSLEFIGKLESKEFTNEEKLQVMQSIAKELLVSFDAKKLQLKLRSTSETDDDMLGKCLRKQVESAMPSSNKQKCNKDAPCVRNDEDILEKVSRKPVEAPMPSPNKQNCDMNYEAAPARCIDKVKIQINPANAQALPDDIVRFDENSRKHQSEKSDETEHSEKPVPSGDTKRRNIPKDVNKVNRKNDRPSERELIEAFELDLNGLPKQGTVAAKSPETESNKAAQFSAKPKKSVKEHHNEKENKEALPYYHRSRMPRGPDHAGRCAESNLSAQDLENKGKGSPVTPLSGNTRHKAQPSCAKLNGANMKNHIGKEAKNGLLNYRPEHLVDLEQTAQAGQDVTSFLKRPQHLADLGHMVQKEQGVTESIPNTRPPYGKPKSTNIQPVNSEPEKRAPNDCIQHNIPGQAEHLADKAVPRPVSVRTRKPLVPIDEAPNKEKGADPDHSGNGTDSAVGNGKHVHRTPSSHSKRTGRRNGALNQNNDYDGFRHRQPEDATAIDSGNLLPRHASARTRRKSGRLVDLDEEERMMDILLMHFSKKGLDPTKKYGDFSEAPTDPQQKVSLQPQPLGRALSLPPVSVGSGEDQKMKVFARSTSLQPGCSRAVRVHPKMPDFDELSARVNALRNA